MDGMCEIADLNKGYRTKKFKQNVNTVKRECIIQVYSVPVNGLLHNEHIKIILFLHNRSSLLKANN